MRASVARGLSEELIEDELGTLADLLREHMRALMPAVAELAGREPRDSVRRYVAIACVQEARRKLRMGDGLTLPARTAVVQRLARSVNALCDHYVSLGGCDVL